MKRQIKKNSKNARCQFIADKIGTIQRGVWVKYFQRYPKDLSTVVSFLKKAEKQSTHRPQLYIPTLKKDLRSNYCNPGFDSKNCEYVIWQLRNWSFLEYMRFRNKNTFNSKVFCLSYNPVLNPPKDFKI